MNKRNIKISRDIINGQTLAAVGAEHNISSSRARQILCRVQFRAKGYSWGEWQKKKTSLREIRDEKDYWLGLIDNLEKEENYEEN